jgi:hypothetical protein
MNEQSLDCKLGGDPAQLGAEQAGFFGPAARVSFLTRECESAHESRFFEKVATRRF